MLPLDSGRTIVAEHPGMHKVTAAIIALGGLGGGDLHYAHNSKHDLISAAVTNLNFGERRLNAEASSPSWFH